MFETISGHSKAAKPRRARAFLIALCLHAAALGGALFVMQTKEVTTIASAEPVLRFPVNPGPRRPVITAPAGNSAAVSSNEKPKHKPFKPRATPADPVSVPVEAEPLAAPAAIDSSSRSGSDSPTNILGTGEGDAGSSDVPESAPCPPGAVCSMNGSEQVLVFNSSMTRPRPDCDPPAPLAPQAARQFGIEGRVVVQYVIHADGRADAVNILNSDAPPMYSEAVRAWIEGCNFTPAQMEGAPRSVKMIQSFHFAVK